MAHNEYAAHNALLFQARMYRNEQARIARAFEYTPPVRRKRSAWERFAAYIGRSFA